MTPPEGLRLDDITSVGPFEFRWPEPPPEKFERGWEALVEAPPNEYHLKIGLGSRPVYGCNRAHLVVWVDRDPTVEGVGADDFERSRCLVSTIKLADRTLVRELDDLPPGYESLWIVDHREEIDARYSRRGLAVKIHEEDLRSWALHAILRVRIYAAARPVGSGGPGRPPETGPPLRPPAPQPTRTPPNRRVIVDALLAVSGREVSNRKPGGHLFTPSPAADRLVRSNPFAFLLAVLFDQGIPAERAWAAPEELRRRLGHLDPRRLIEDRAAVEWAVSQPPALHRYVNTLPGWIVSAANRVISVHGGEAAKIWNDRPTARRLHERLEAFTGIGQKKAAMAAELLERDLGVEILEMEGSDIAFDVHLRRVFLRTGLAERDDREHMIRAARVAYPERPGALDFPAWLVGREWCGAGVPRCGDCPLALVCPRRLDRALSVKGA